MGPPKPRYIKVKWKSFIDLRGRYAMRLVAMGSNRELGRVEFVDGKYRYRIGASVGKSSRSEVTARRRLEAALGVECGVPG